MFAFVRLRVYVCARRVFFFARVRAYENESFEFVDKMPHT